MIRARSRRGSDSFPPEVRALPDEARKRELKKLAVKWHPDRNKENPELATRLFQMINF